MKTGSFDSELKLLKLFWANISNKLKIHVHEVVLRKIRNKAAFNQHLKKKNHTFLKNFYKQTFVSEKCWHPAVLDNLKIHLVQLSFCDWKLRKSVAIGFGG
jgi:hypothetical protein